MATVGKNILENLTTGMYSDSIVIYREYVQNACDQIDKAIALGILDEESGSIDITVDSKSRCVQIYDNATGVRKDDFVENLGDIANSNKRAGEEKGFRGIGRLCGLAYCRTLTFKTSYKGESCASVMKCDARKMRDMLSDAKKYTLDEVWESITSYTTEPEKPDAHYFLVALDDVNHENTDLLDRNRIKDYLSFVAPVPYVNKFYFRSKIYDYAKGHGYAIDEYRITVDGAQVLKNYSTKIKDGSGRNSDEITELEFFDLKDPDGNILGWLWFGLCQFNTAITPKNNPMRSLRLRAGNIQIGGEDTLTKFFKEARGNHYFVGEVFAVHKDLRPNSQRNYFSENPTRVSFENALRNYCYTTLHNLYTKANQIKNAYKRQTEYSDKVEEFEKKSAENGFVNEEEKAKARDDIAAAKAKSEEARRALERIEKTSEKDPAIDKVRRQIEKARDGKKAVEKASKIKISDKGQKRGKGKGSYVAADLSKLSKKERKLVTKILTIVSDVAPKDVAEEIVKRMQEELR